MAAVKRSGFILLLILLAMTACFSPAPSLEQEIIGKWANSEGGEINFYEDGTGYVPGIAGQPTGNIPALQFTYAIEDETHLVINTTALRQANRQDIVIEVEIENDTMTWRSNAGSVEFEYRRAE